MQIVNPLKYCGENNAFIIGEHFDAIPAGYCISCGQKLEPHSEEYNEPLGFDCYIRYAQDTGYCKACTLHHKKNDCGELFTRLVNNSREEPYKVQDIGNEQKAYFNRGGDPSQIFQKVPVEKERANKEAQ